VRIAAWPTSAALGAQLNSFYGSVHDTAAAGLVASVQNASAYRAAATAMLSLLDGMAVIDDAVRSSASSAGVELPESSVPQIAP
jgi:hypothetical protein